VGFIVLGVYWVWVFVGVLWSNPDFVEFGGFLDFYGFSVIRMSTAR